MVKNEITQGEHVEDEQERPLDRGSNQSLRSLLIYLKKQLFLELLQM